MRTLYTARTHCSLCVQIVHALATRSCEGDIHPQQADSRVGLLELNVPQLLQVFIVIGLWVFCGPFANASSCAVTVLPVVDFFWFFEIPRFSHGCIAGRVGLLI